jgi:hypothetical protein
MVRAYDQMGNLIEMHEHEGNWAASRSFGVTQQLQRKWDRR